MPDYKELAIYAVIAVAVVVAVVFVVSSGLLSKLFSSSYNVRVTLSQTGGSATVYPYQTSQFTINVTNNGNAAIQNLLVGFYLPGSS